MADDELDSAVKKEEEPIVSTKLPETKIALKRDFECVSIEDSSDQQFQQRKQQKKESKSEKSQGILKYFKKSTDDEK